MTGFSNFTGLSGNIGLWNGNSGLWGGATGLIEGGASLYLNFLAGAPLDSRVTFSRGSNATLVDSTGKITYAPSNLVLRSQEFTVSPWVKGAVGTATAPVLTANSAIAPDGTMTATLGVFNRGAGTSSDRSTLTQTVSVTAGTYIQSMWLKAATPDDVGKQIAIRSVGGASYLIINLTATWERYTKTEVQLTSAYEIVNRQGFTADTTVSLLIWGAQLEQVTYQTTPSTYVATTSAAYYGPRFDYDPVTLAAKGLLIEEQRTNLLVRSEELDNAAWTKSAVTITANATAAPDGTSTADKLTPDVTLATHFAGQTVTTTAVAHTYSAYLKAGGYSWAILYAAGVNQGVYFDLANGVVGSSFIGAPTSSSITPVGNGWYRCSITFTATTGTAARVYASSANTVSTFAGDGTSGIFVYGAQLEAGAFATSYIPTVASQVTRSADQASMTGTNFSSWYNQPQGTFVAIFTPDLGLTSNATRVMSTTSGGVSNRVVDTYVSGTNWVNYNGTTTTTVGAAVATSIPQRIAIAYTTANYGYVLNGGSVTVDTTALVNTPTLFNIGNMNTASQLNGHIRQIAYYNTRLPNATLQALTA